MARALNALLDGFEDTTTLIAKISCSGQPRVHNVHLIPTHLQMARMKHLIVFVKVLSFVGRDVHLVGMSTHIHLCTVIPFCLRLFKCQLHAWNALPHVSNQANGISLRPASTLVASAFDDMVRA